MKRRVNDPLRTEDATESTADAHIYSFPFARNVADAAPQQLRM